MESRLRFRLNNCATVTALTYHPIRRDIITGHEDGSVRCWESDTGKLSLRLAPHRGWVTALHYWTEGKVLFSCSVDGTVVQISPKGSVCCTVDVGRALYSLCWCHRRAILLVGCDKSLAVLHLLDKQSMSGLQLLEDKVTAVKCHDDIVSCVIAVGSKVYTSGTMAHDAGICSMAVGTNKDGTSWIFTGSFDWTVKIWSMDGKLGHTMQFMQPVTSVCFVPETAILWVAAGVSRPLFFEPRSGNNVSNFLDQSPFSGIQEESGFLQWLYYIPEAGEVVGVSSSKETRVWRYNSAATVCCQQLGVAMETLTYTNKEPILIFTGSNNGRMTKWERLQLNHFMYSTDELLYKEDLKQHLASDGGSRNLRYFLPGGDKEEDVELDEGDKKKAMKILMKDDWRGFVKSKYIEALDLLAVSSQDGRICVWGYDEQAAQVLRSMQHNTMKGTYKHTDNDKDESLLTYSRVAGVVVKHILNGHSGSVPGLAVVPADSIPGKNHSPYLLSAGWDLCVCVWQLENGSLELKVEQCIPQDDVTENEEVLITDMDYCPKNNTFAYSVSNGHVYLRTLSLNKTGSQIVASFGHGQESGEISQVCWNEITEQWVTGTDTGVVSVWSDNGSTCDGRIATKKAVHVICIDRSNGALVVGLEDTIRVYNDKLDVVMVCHGHTDIVRSIIHIPERNQYVSVSWDGSMRIWHSYQSKSVSN